MSCFNGPGNTATSRLTKSLPFQCRQKRSNF